MRFVLIIIILVVSYSCGGNKKVERKPNLSPIMEKALLDPGSEFYADFAQFPKEKKMLPIGVFDSGTGGLTVLEVLLSIDKMDNITGKPGSDGIADFEGENFTYLSDRANMPYGNYAAEGKENFFKELVIKDALFLLGNKYFFNHVDNEPLGIKEPSKILVVACNTATAYGLNDIKVLLDESNTGVKVVGIINAGVNALFDILKKEEEIQVPKKDSTAVGILATPGTISSNVYERTIRESEIQKRYRGHIKVINQPGVGFAEAVDMERDFADISLKFPRSTYRGPRIGNGAYDIKLKMLPIYNFNYESNGILINKLKDSITDFQLNSASNYARFDLVTLVEKHRMSGSTTPLKHVILGCTHYPFLLDTLNKVITELRKYSENGIYKYRDIIAEDFSFIDPAIYTAIECYNILRANKELALRTVPGKLDAYISVPVFGLDVDKLDGDGNLSYEFKYGRDYGTEDITTVFVPFSRRYITKENIDRIEETLPRSFKQIKNIID
ncbi:MAG: hypothetical protein RR183_07360 [Bacteroidales bacterium]